MTHTIILESKNQFNEIEWSERIEAKNKRSARMVATKFLKNNLFEDDYQNIEKQVWGTREYWRLV